MLKKDKYYYVEDSNYNYDGKNFFMIGLTSSGSLPCKGLHMRHSKTKYIICNDPERKYQMNVE